MGIGKEGDDSEGDGKEWSKKEGSAKIKIKNVTRSINGCTSESLPTGSHEVGRNKE